MRSFIVRKRRGPNMAGVNKCILIGNLGADVELRYTKDNTAVANVSIATSRKWKDNTDQWQEATEWHKVVLWGRQAETAAEYLRKGSKVYIEGRLETRSWEDKEGNKRHTTEVVAQAVQFLDRKGEGDGAQQHRSRGNGGGNGQRSQQRGNSSQQRSGGQRQQQRQPEYDLPDDELPF